MSCDMCMIFYRIALHYDELLRRPFIRAPSKHVIIWHMEKHETIAQKMLFLHDNDTVLYLHVALFPPCPRISLLAESNHLHCHTLPQHFPCLYISFQNSVLAARLLLVLGCCHPYLWSTSLLHAPQCLPTI